MTCLRTLAACLAALLALTACGPRTPDGPPPDSAGDFEGAWHGALSIAGQSLRLELVLEEGTDGVEGVLISLDQNNTQMPLTALTLEGDTITFAANPPGLSYEGELEGDQITGRFRQSVLSVDLVFERGRFDAGDTQDPAESEAQMRANESAISVAAGAVTLAGTLRLPEGDGAVPGVVILSGSGSQDRDGTFGAVRI